MRKSRDIAERLAVDSLEQTVIALQDSIAKLESQKSLAFVQEVHLGSSKT